MDILIVEDEQRAAMRLKKMVQECYPQARVPEPLDTVEDAVQYLKTEAEPTALLLDIELADGKSFEILQQVHSRIPVIFCTAFDQYALEAFRYHGVAYLLKPIKKEELQEALKHALQQGEPAIDYARLAEVLQQQKPRYQERLLIRLGQRYKTLVINDIAYIYTRNKMVVARTFAKKDTPLDQNLEQMEEILDPSLFFRVNRQMILQFKAIEQMYAWSRARLKIDLIPPFDSDVVVATDRAASFKKWLEAGG